MENKEKTFDVDTIMDILYGEYTDPWENKGFVCAADGKKVISEGEIIRNNPEEENSLTRKRDYNSFWRKKNN